MGRALRFRTIRRSAAAALLLASCFAVIQPGNALAACDPHGSDLGEAWQSGAYLSGISPSGVHADIEGYHPYVRSVPDGSWSLATVMIDYNGSWWTQPGWHQSTNMQGFLDGYHSFVQFWDQRGIVTQQWSSAHGCPGSDPAPPPGTFTRYAALVSFDGGTGLYLVDVKMAGLECWQFKTANAYNRVEIFGEIINVSAQFPGDNVDHERLQTVEWRDWSGSWHNVNVNTPTSIPDLGWNNVSGYADRYAVWDRRCP